MRSMFLALVLSVSAPALACGDGDCGGNCPMQHAANDSASDFQRVDKAQGTKLAFAVTGLKCGKCAAKVIAAVTGLEGVNAAAVDHENGRAKVAFDPKKTDEKAIRKAIADLGYTPGATEA